MQNEQDFGWVLFPTKSLSLHHLVAFTFTMLAILYHLIYKIESSIKVSLSMLITEPSIPTCRCTLNSVLPMQPFKLRWILSFDVLKKKMGLIFFLLNLNYLNPNARINDILVNTFFFFLLYGTKEVLFVYISCGITLVNYIYIYIYIY